MNVGEEITAAYLRAIRGCEFTQQNLQTRDSHGEIDVIGVNIADRIVYVCEVAVHLTSGLRYVKDKRPGTVMKLIEKFSRDIEYATKYWPDYKRVYMLWSPIVKGARDHAKENQLLFVEEIQKELRSRFGVDIQCVINSDFEQCLNELRKFARETSEELKSPVLRYLQIEEWLKKHMKRNQ